MYIVSFSFRHSFTYIDLVMTIRQYLLAFGRGKSVYHRELPLLMGFAYLFVCDPKHIGKGDRCNLLNKVLN